MSKLRFTACFLAVLSAVSFYAAADGKDAKPAKVAVHLLVLRIPTSKVPPLLKKEGQADGPALWASSLGPDAWTRLRDVQLPVCLEAELRELIGLNVTGGKQEVIKTDETFHYLEKADGDTFRIRTFRHHPVNIKATATVNGKWVQLALDGGLSRIEGRVPFAPAPELDVGRPLMAVTHIRTTLAVADGGAVVLAARRGQNGPQDDPIIEIWLMSATVKR